MKLSSPSDRFPPATGIAIDVPESWAPDDAPAAVLPAYDTDSPDHFRVNATVAIERVQAGSQLAQIAARFAEAAAADLPDYVVHGEEQVSHDGLARFIRLHGYQPEGISFPIFQAQCLALVPIRQAAIDDLVQLHATCPADVAERYGTVFRAIVDSLTFTRPPP